MTILELQRETNRVVRENLGVYGADKIHAKTVDLGTSEELVFYVDAPLVCCSNCNEKHRCGELKELGRISF